MSTNRQNAKKHMGFSCIRYKTEGVKGLYNGGHVRLLEQLTTNLHLLFLLYFTQLFTLFVGGNAMGSLSKLSVGYVAAVANTLVTLLIQVISAVMMVESSGTNSRS